jgi:phosphoglycolate phosphatase-like HAD superfamily hydrolase
MTSRTVKAFILDVDGTLLDSVPSHIDAWAKTFELHGYFVERDTIHRFVGMGSDKMIPRLTGLSSDDPKVKAITAMKTEIYDTQYLPHVRPFPGVQRLIHELDRLGMRVAVAASATGEKLERLLCIAGCENHVPAESCTEGRSKPDPDKVIGAVNWLGFKPEQCIMVGDSPYDAQAAASAGVPFIGLRAGGRRDDELQPALGVFQDPAELADYIATLVQQAA